MRSDIIDQLMQYFRLQELVCSHVYSRFGERSWQFLSTALLETLIIIRLDILKTGITINNWSSGGELSQRGLRCNLCQLVKDKTKRDIFYLSAHNEGCAVDFDAKLYTAEQVRDILIDNSNKLPFPIRIENDVNWVHIDVFDPCNDNKINFFNA
jgi:hypothetical protein